MQDTPKMTGKYLINTDNWFTAPDGRQYKAVFGEVTILEDTFLGVKTNARSSNWFVRVGSDESHVVIAGCQIHYSVKCESVHTRRIKYFEKNEDGAKEYDYDSRIYVP